MVKRASDKQVVVIGAGPAGLAAAYQLLKQGYLPIVIEKGDRVGGIARTEVYKGYRFDIGGHRFFTKDLGIKAIWVDNLGEALLNVSRISRIYYQGRFMNYPLGFRNGLSNIGLIESIRIFISYLKAQIMPYQEESTFEQWVSNRFGRRLYAKFFEPYTTKVWGIPCSDIPADWAKQRIKGLSLISALSDALFKNQKVRSLAHEFLYPRRGPGMMWGQLKEKIEQQGGQFFFNRNIIGLDYVDRQITAVRCVENNQAFEIPVKQLISSLPLTDLVSMLSSCAPEEVLHAASSLSYRALIIVVLILDKAEVFPDQWIYIHSPGFKVGRIQNFKNWSSAMVPDQRTTSLGLEYFCNEGGKLWSLPDSELASIATHELTGLGFAQEGEVRDWYVVRQPGAYPIYHDGYKERLKTIRTFLDGFKNLQTIGRNGMHRYNNMDHSMQTGILAARNILGSKYDVWAVNEEDTYLEAS